MHFYQCYSFEEIIYKYKRICSQTHFKTHDFKKKKKVQ